jgi:hypothetical protein
MHPVQLTRGKIDHHALNDPSRDRISAVAVLSAKLLVLGIEEVATHGLIGIIGLVVAVVSFGVPVAIEAVRRPKLKISLHPGLMREVGPLRAFRLHA